MPGIDPEEELRPLSSTARASVVAQLHVQFRGAGGLQQLLRAEAERSGLSSSVIAMRATALALLEIPWAERDRIAELASLLDGTAWDHGFFAIAAEVRNQMNAGATITEAIDQVAAMTGAALVPEGFPP